MDHQYKPTLIYTVFKLVSILVEFCSVRLNCRILL